MRIRAKKVQPQHKLVGGEPTQKVPAKTFTFPAPMRGLVLNTNAANAPVDSARILDNWICTTDGVKVRGGLSKIATLNAAATHFARYVSSSETLFAATATEITDITSPADPDVAGTPAVTGQTSGNYASTQFGTAGGDFLYLVNGSDDPQLYDGSTWTAINGASSPAITGVTTANLSHVWSHANRLFFVESGTMTAHYLPVSSIGGAVSQVSLAGVFKNGGSLLFGATWSMDAGDGLDDKCVFVSTEGEVAVYSGTDPSTAANWSLDGRYVMPRPLGKNAHTSAGGDLLIATESGVIPVSMAVSMDVAAQMINALSASISTYWQSSDATNVEMVKVPKENIMIVSQPSTTGNNALCVNLQTAAWSRFTGWDTQAIGFFNDKGVMGDSSGFVYYMNSGGNDNGSLYTARCLYNFSGLGEYGVTKSSRMMRPIFTAGSDYTVKLVAKADFNITEEAPPASPADYVVDGWDVGLWDQAIWDAEQGFTSSGSWVSAQVTGSFIAPDVYLSFNVTPMPNVSLVSIDATYSSGEVVT